MAMLATPVPLPCSAPPEAAKASAREATEFKGDMLEDRGSARDGGCHSEGAETPASLPCCCMVEIDKYRKLADAATNSVVTNKNRWRPLPKGGRAMPFAVPLPLVCAGRAPCSARFAAPFPVLAIFSFCSDFAFRSAGALKMAR